MLLEQYLFLAASIGFGLTTLLALMAWSKNDTDYKQAVIVLAGSVLVIAAAILVRWSRLDHGPYVDLRETLISSIWGYNTALLIGVIAIKRIRPIMIWVCPVLLMMVFWALMVTPRDGLMPVTYDTPWLFIHISLGKVFIGCVVVALGLSMVILSRRFFAKSDNGRLAFPSMPSDKSLDELAFRFMMIGFIFDSAMLIIGAIWAHDAWGRYWAWDPLEVWSFLTWLSGAIYLHLRLLKTTPVVRSFLVLAVFIFAFLTYFGIPFISSAAHQGVV